MPRPADVTEGMFALLPLVGLQLIVLWALIRRGDHLAARRENNASAAHTQLAQDLHDGVGYHLTSIIAGLEDGNDQQRATAGALQQCLLELKLLVDGTVTDESVLGHLANLRYRTQPSLDAAGVQLNWEVQQTDVLESVKGDVAVQVLRIAQEAMANVIRHSGAHTVLLRCQVLPRPPELVLELCDDGRGLPPSDQAAGRATEGATRGHGLRSMRARARRLGARLCIESAPGLGTCVKLRMPLDSQRRPSTP